MKTLNRLVAVFFVITPATVLAGTGDSAGGDAVLCYENSQVADSVLQEIRSRRDSTTPANLRLDELRKPPEMYDIVEHTFAEGPISPFPLEYNEGYTYQDVIEELYNLGDQGFASFIGASYAGESLWFPREFGVPEIDDATFMGKIEPGCIVVQVALNNPRSRTVHYDVRIVELMSSFHQAALELHEKLYIAHHWHQREWHGKPAEDSDVVRPVVAWLLTRYHDQKYQSPYWAMLRQGILEYGKHPDPVKP